MDHQPLHHHINEQATEPGDLWLLQMFLNLLFTGIGQSVKYNQLYGNNKQIHSTNCSDLTGHILAQRCHETLVLASSITLYLALGTMCLAYGPRHRWLRGILVLTAGTLYLAGDNLGLVDRCLDDLRSYLLGASLTLAIAPAVYKFYGERLGEDRGFVQSGLRSASELAVDIMFPMLMFTVQIDQVYTTIVGEVSHHKQEFQDGSKCSERDVLASISFFVFVCITWTVVVSCVVGKHWCYISKYKRENPNTSIKGQEIVLMLFLVVLVLYAPAYIALDNWAPWICVAEYHCQEGSTVDYEGVKMYFIVKIVLLFGLSLFTAFLLLVYCCTRTHNLRVQMYFTAKKVCLFCLDLFKAISTDIYIRCCTRRRCPRQRQDDESEPLFNHSADDTKQA